MKRGVKDKPVVNTGIMKQNTEAESTQQSIREEKINAIIFFLQKLVQGTTQAIIT